MVKQSYPSFSYNQIRFLLAYLIRDLEVWLSIPCFEKKSTWILKYIKNFGLRFYYNYCYSFILTINSVYFSDKTVFLCVYFWREKWLIIVNVVPAERETLVNGILWLKSI